MKRKTSKTRFLAFTSGWDDDALQLIFLLHWYIRTVYIPDSEMVGIFCSRANGENPFSDQIFRMAKELNIPIIAISVRDFEPDLRRSDIEKWRALYHQAVRDFIPEADYIYALGYMQIIPEVEVFPPIFNLHPASPFDGPQGTYIEVIWKLIEQGAENTGAMIHRMTNDLDDTSCVVAYDLFPIVGEFDTLWQEFRARLEADNSMSRKDAFERIKTAEKTINPLWLAIRLAGTRREIPLMIESARLLSSGEVVIGESGKVFDGEGRALPRGYDLSAMINERIEEDQSHEG